ncbi:DegQ family serine endoprotease [Candidatus Methylopumilus turicensis]|uniref:Probable periplasmic serine endoprotease DegP-like n=1 Tax=Candidatus Methylopumilus turicensis TaxID=1581680 RepID=A0A0B7IV07_9PROT|nr:DegQ family serine endoprotease [Candidatus Methylopumilus turicensis]CEN56121.1 putative periplasmic serine endoprotease DegP-like [Candidatus Methylopumilus turicensis]
MIKKIVILSIFLLSIASSIFAKELPDFTELAEKQGPSVVNISVTQVVQGNANPFGGLQDDEQFNELFRRFGLPVPGAPRGQAPQQDFKSQSLGSGFIISADGYILTNAHVINAADEVIVKLSDRREFKAKIIGSDRRTDVALLKIDASGLPKVSIGDPNQLKVGEWVAAIGSPFGLENTMTAGIVSAKGRALPQENFVPFIQTDVAINPGNSGGPLFNLKGEVVGINSQIYSRSGGSMGLSFAIPIDVAMDVSNQIKAGGKISRGWLGVSIQEITKDLAESFGMKNTNGALVAGVEKSGPADKSGLLAGDVILKFDNKMINASSDLPRAVGGIKPGRTVNVDVLRKGAMKTLSVTVGEAPNDKDEVNVSNKGNAKPEANRIGLVLNELTPQQKKKLNGKNGLLVVDAQGASAAAGVRRGDIVLGINNAEVSSVEQFAKTLAAIPNGKTVAVLISRGEGTLYVPIKLSDAK